MMSWMIGPAPNDGSGLARSATSLPVTTAITPGSRSAASVRIARIFACACGLRTIAACAIPGSLMSSM